MKSFKPYLVVIFINAFIDLGHKITMQNIILKSFDATTQIVLSAILGAFLILPFVGFFSLSGYLSDRIHKNRLMQYLSGFNIVISLASIALYLLGDFWSLYFLTLLYSLQAAIFSPAKFGYIKDMTPKENILKINAAVQAVTTVAMISAGLIFSICFELILNKQNLLLDELTSKLWIIGLIITVLVSIEAIISLKLKTPEFDLKAIKIDTKKLLMLGYLKENLQEIKFWRIFLVLSVFWATAQIISAVFPPYAETVLHITNTIAIQEKLAMIIVGMVAGSYVCAKLDRGFIDLGLASVGAFGMGLAILAMTFVTSNIAISISFLIFGFFGSCFIVPLNSFIQYKTDETKIGRTIASLNFVQSFAMLFALIITTALAYSGINSKEIFWLSALLLFVVSFFVSNEPVKEFVRFFISSLFSIRYKIKRVGNVKEDSGVLLIGNHVSWIDWALIQTVYPSRIYFVMDSEIFSQKKWQKVLEYFDVVPISPKLSKSTILHIRQLLLDGKTVCIFPEGEITQSGEVCEFKKGFELILKSEKLSHIKVKPFYIDGLFGSIFSYSKNKNKSGIKREVDIYFGDYLEYNISASSTQNIVNNLKK